MSNLILVGATVVFSLFLLGYETWAVAVGQPTISERIQRLGRSAPLVVVIVCTLTGMALIHFFGS